MIRVVTSFKKAEGKSAEWCSNYYRTSHVKLARKAFSKFPYIKKFTTSRVLRQMEVIKGRNTEQPEVLWIGEVYFEGLAEFDSYLQAQSVSEQLADDRVYASELDVFICGEEEVILDQPGDRRVKL